MRDYNIRTAATVVLYEYKYSLYVFQSRASRSRCSIPGTWHGTCKDPTDYTNQRYGGGLSRAYKLLVSRDYLIARTCYKQSNAFLMRRRMRSAVSPWNVDPLRSTTLRRIRSARSGLRGQRSFRSSALYSYTRSDSHATLQSR